MTTEAVVAALPVFRNEFLSVSRLKRLEQCPLSFYYQYVNRPDRLLGLADSEPAEFGTVLHDALERVYRWVVDEEYAGMFPEAELLEFFRLAWADSGLGGVALYQEGRELLRRYAQNVGTVDHMRVLAVEREFNLLLGPGTCRLVDGAERPQWKEVDGYYVVNGYIDRVDRVDGETVEVVDYKSGRLLFAKDDLGSDLQLSVYAIVAYQLFPWARSVRLSFHMLRHGIVQRTGRTHADLADAIDYVLAMGTRSEKGPYPPRLNTYCGSCDHRTRCDAYKIALDRKLEVVAVSETDLGALAQERERVARIAKAAYARKEQLDAVLRAAIGEAESVELAGVVYRLVQYFDTDYPIAELLALFREVGADLAPALHVDNKALDALLDAVEKDEGVPHTVRDFLRVRVAAKAVKIPQRPRIDARPKKR
jgi:putative RecB family exonuclease